MKEKKQINIQELIRSKSKKTMQAMEVLKIILKRGKIFKNAMLYVDLETGQMNEFAFEKRK